MNAYSPHARDSLLHRSLDLVAGRENKPPLRQNGESAVHSPEFLFDGFSPPALAGRYTGSYLGEIWVDATGDALDVTVGPSGSRQSNFRIAATKMGFAIQSQVPIAIGFRKGKDGTPILYLGVHAYKPA